MKTIWVASVLLIVTGIIFVAADRTPPTKTIPITSGPYFAIPIPPGD